jgi:hypothetical protein
MHADCICFETYGENRERWEVVDDWKDRRPRGMQAAAYLRDPCLFGSALAVLSWPGYFSAGGAFRPPTLVINTTFEAEFCQQ